MNPRLYKCPFNLYSFLELLTNLFSKGNSYPVVSIGEFPKQLYVTTLIRGAGSHRRLCRRLNQRRIIVRHNTYRAENLVTQSRGVVRANRSESIVRPSEVHSSLEVSEKREVLVTPEVKDYATPVVCKNSLTNLSSNPTLVVSKCSDVIPRKFKTVKFTIK